MYLVLMDQDYFKMCTDCQFCIYSIVDYMRNVIFFKIGKNHKTFLYYVKRSIHIFIMLTVESNSSKQTIYIIMCKTTMIAFM